VNIGLYTLETTRNMTSRDMMMERRLSIILNLGFPEAAVFFEL
jgi:hypothetical protein